ncbi:MAG: membrane protein insertase YidC, partial [Cytophagales bacterium]|nr:membrane protein insertase YidC [Cytophagales bacterium]
RQEELLEGGSGERANSTVNYYTLAEDFDNLSKTGEDQESVGAPLKWFAFKQHFFTSALIAESSMKNAEFSISVPEGDTTVVKNFNAKFVLPLADLKTQGHNFTYFFGPNSYELLKNVTPGFNDNVDLGWPVISWVNKYVVIWVFNLLQDHISSYGIIILILVVLIKLVLFPLSFKSYMSMAKMKVLKPEIDKIKEEHDGDMSKVQMAQMELYKQVGVSPLSGCVPMLLQMPILFAMFRFFPNSIELRGQSFLWAHDLSTYDVLFRLPVNIPLIGDHISGFCLLMTASTLAYTWSNNQMSTVEGPMKSVQYLMPLMFFFVLNSFPAGLTYYYFLSNLVTLGQQAVIRKFVDEDKVKVKLEENRRKNKAAGKKKSSFQQRLEEAMKASQEAKKNKKK